MSTQRKRQTQLLQRRIQQIREYVNDPLTSHQLRRDKAKWSQLCCSMDAVADCEDAIEAHQRLARSRRKWDTGLLYLMHYGLAASLGLQQDAVGHLRLSLGLPEVNFNEHPQLGPIRALRNDVIHQTERGRGNRRRFMGIVQRSLKPDEFSVYGFGSDGKSEWPPPISPSKIIDIQHESLGELLDEVIEYLEGQVKQRKERFSGQALVAVFPNQKYPLEKIAVAAGEIVCGEIRSESSCAMAMGGLNVLEKRLDGLVSAVRERGWESGVHEHLDQTANSFKKAILRMKELLSSHEPAPLEVEAINELLVRRFDELFDLAKDLDDYYVS